MPYYPPASIGEVSASNENYKNAVSLATTENITLSGEQTIDGILTSGSRVLVKDQTDASQNGIYGSGPSAWVRSLDADTSAELAFASVYVTGGATQGGFRYGFASDTSITLGTDDVNVVLIGDNSELVTAVNLSLSTSIRSASQLETLLGVLEAQNGDLKASIAAVSGFGAMVGDNGVVSGDTLGIFRAIVTDSAATRLTVSLRTSRAVDSVAFDARDGTSGGGFVTTANTVTAGPDGSVIYMAVIDNAGLNAAPVTEIFFRVDDREVGVGSSVTVYDFRVTPHLEISNPLVENYDYVVGQNVSDLLALASVLNVLPASEVVSAYVPTGIYSGQNLDCQNIDCTAYVKFGKGSKITNTPGVTGSCIQAYGTGILEIEGNGLVIEDFDTGTGNALGQGGTARLVATRVKTIRCYDGTSAHGSPRADGLPNMETVDCEFLDSGKFAVAHVGTATYLHKNCVFESTENPVGGVAITNAQGGSFVNCEFRYKGAAAQTVNFGDNTALNKCLIGTKELAVTISGDPVATSCFINATAIQANHNPTFKDCSGYATLRPREAGGSGAGVTFEGGVYDAPSGLSSFVNADYTPPQGNFSPISVSNVLLGKGFTTGLTLSNSTRRSYWDAAGSTFQENTILGANIADAEGALATGVSGNAQVSFPSVGDALVRSSINAMYEISGVQ